MLTQRDEDYLVCSEYQDRLDLKSTEYPDFISFQHPDSNYYFAWVNGKDIILRSEAYPDEDRMIRGIKAVVRNREFPQRYSVEERDGAYYVVLWGGDVNQKHSGNFASHNEIGRSCPRKSRQELYDLLLFRGRGFADGVVPLAGGAATAAAKLAAPVAASDDDEEGGFKWWWLLPLLLIPLFLLYRGCSKTGPDVAAPAPPPKISTAVPPAAPPVVKPEPAPPKPEPTPAPVVPAKAEVPACDLNWIFFDFDRFDIRSDARAELMTLTELLKKNGQYTALLSAYTDAKGSDAYNQRLSRNRANAAKEVLVKAGIDSARIDASAFSEAAPIAANTEDDAGRKFNRRVELRVKDAAGREVCKSIPPSVPDNLKQ